MRTLPFAAAVVAMMAVSRAAAPPRGWDSYDGWPIWAGYRINETEVLATAAVLGGPLKGGAYEYLIIDEGWADKKDASEKGGFHWFLDEFGRPIPDPILFPSAVNGTYGFTGLVDRLATEHKLRLGLWLVKGIPKQAVAQALPIFGTNYTAKDIAASSGAGCPWHEDVALVNMSHPAAQAYYDSVYALYASWGVGYVKVDCIYGTDYRYAEIVGVSNAVSRAPMRQPPTLPPQQVTMRLGLSPGALATTKMAESLTATGVDAYRVTEDLWDCWAIDAKRCPDMQSVVSTIELLAAFYSPAMQRPLIGAYGQRIYRDGDMLLVGRIRLRADHWAAFTENQTALMLGLWSMAQSPVILGGDVTMQAAQGNPSSAWLLPLLNNTALARMHQRIEDQRTLRFVPLPLDVNRSGACGTVVYWGREAQRVAAGERPAVYVALFSYAGLGTLPAGACDRTESLTWAEMGVVAPLLSPPTVSVTDVLRPSVPARIVDTASVPHFALSAAGNSAAIYRIETTSDQ